MTQPEKKFVQGNCSATIFGKEMSKNGKSFVVYDIVLQRSYKDKDGEWKNTNSFGVNDLPKVSVAAGKAYDYLTTIERDE